MFKMLSNDKENSQRKRKNYMILFWKKNKVQQRMFQEFEDIFFNTKKDQVSKKSFPLTMKKLGSRVWIWLKKSLFILLIFLEIKKKKKKTKNVLSF